MKEFLIGGGTGAIGRHLLHELLEEYGPENIVAGYNRRKPTDVESVPFDVTNREQVEEVFRRYTPRVVYHLVGKLSREAERDPVGAKLVNEAGLTNVLREAKKYRSMLVWPSSIGRYGSLSPKIYAPEDSILNPSTDYGRGKIAGEREIRESGIDGRILIVPGVLGPGEHGEGTTESAIDMVQSAVRGEPFKDPLKETTWLPYIDIRDLVRAFMMITKAPRSAISGPYNVPGYSFTPRHLADILKRMYPNFEVTFEDDSGAQKIAASWPWSILGSRILIDIGYSPQHGLVDSVEYVAREEEKLTVKRR